METVMLFYNSSPSIIIFLQQQETDYIQDIFVQNNLCFWSLDTQFAK